MINKIRKYIDELILNYFYKRYINLYRKSDETGKWIARGIIERG